MGDAGGFSLSWREGDDCAEFHFTSTILAVDHKDLEAFVEAYLKLRGFSIAKTGVDATGVRL